MSHREASWTLKRYGANLPEEKDNRLSKLRFRLLAAPEKQRRFCEKERAELAETWELIAGSIVEEVNQRGDDIKATLNGSASQSEARGLFGRFRSYWPERFMS